MHQSSLEREVTFSKSIVANTIYLIKICICEIKIAVNATVPSIMSSNDLAMNKLEELCLQPDFHGDAFSARADNAREHIVLIEVKFKAE